MQLYDMWGKMDERTGRMVVSQGKMEGGFKITSDYLSSLAQQDFPKAIELLSALSVKGTISANTMNKLFDMDIHSRNTMSKVA